MVAGLALLGALVLTGCEDEAVGESATTPPMVTEIAPSTEPVPTTQDPADDDAATTTAPPQLSAQEQDQADIEHALQHYTSALNDAFNGDASIEEIYPFSRDTAREQWVTEVMAAQAQDVTFSGFTELEVLEVAVDGDTAEVMACADVSDVEAVDENGDSIISESRIDRTLKDFVLERDGSAEFGWYVVSDVSRNEPCEG